jgi:hypothetical protein
MQCQAKSQNFLLCGHFWPICAFFVRLMAYKGDKKSEKLSKKEQNCNNSVTKTLQNSCPVKTNYL